MSTMHRMVLACALTLATGAALAQAASTPGGGPGKGMQGAGPPSSAPGMGPGYGKGARWGTDYTPGWMLMTEAEHQAHQERMRSMTTQTECKAYLQQHREAMAARAKEQGKTLNQPRRDACGQLPP